MTIIVHQKEHLQEMLSL